MARAKATTTVVPSTTSGAGDPIVHTNGGGIAPSDAAPSSVTPEPDEDDNFLLGYGEPFKDTLARLNQEVPTDLIKQREQGGRMLDYIEWHTAVDLLDERAPEWESRVTNIQVINDSVVVTTAITINGVTRENVGIEKLSTNSYGDFASNAFSMAFRRTATLFGIARHLYKKGNHSDDAPRSNNGGTQSKPAVAARADGKLEATLLGMKEGISGPNSKNPGSIYFYMDVEIGNLHIKKFFDQNYTENDMLDDISAPVGAKYPLPCLVKLEKKGKYNDIVAFYPPDAQGDQAVQKNEQSDDDIPF